MLTLFWIVLWAGLAALVVAAGVSLHVRKREALASSVPIVDDDAIERILTTGQLTVEDTGGDFPLIVEDAEPLDHEEIARLAHLAEHPELADPLIALLPPRKFSLKAEAAMRKERMKKYQFEQFMSNLRVGQSGQVTLHVWAGTPTSRLHDLLEKWI